MTPGGDREPNARLTLSNRPENVLLVRQALLGLGEHMELARSDLNDIVTAATEACNNVVLHAYGEQEGPLEVEVSVGPGEVQLLVRDQGGGMRPANRAQAASAVGTGLRVIETLAASSEILEDGGVEVRMSFATEGARPVEAPAYPMPTLVGQIAHRDLEHTVAIETTSVALALTVLPRVLSAVAARARFSVDAISDVRRVTRDLAAGVGEASAEPYVGAATTTLQGRLLTSWGPLASGVAQTMLERTPLQETRSLAIPRAEPGDTHEPGRLLTVQLESHA